MNSRREEHTMRESEKWNTAVVFLIAGGMGATATVVYKRIASMITEKHSKPYNRTINWLRCRLSISLLCGQP